MIFEEDIPARCWIAPETPHAMYNEGETTFPVWPTWCECSIHPASTTALEAPTAAPRSLASSWMRAKFSGPLIPRPPVTMTSASATSSSPLSLARISFTTARISPGTACSASISAAPPTVSAAKTLGRSVTTVGLPAPSSVANAFPE